MIVPQKFKISLILHPLFDMKRQRQIIKDLLFVISIVICHRIEQCLFISQNIVIYQMIMHLHLFYLWHSSYLLLLKIFCTKKKTLVIVLLTWLMSLHVTWDDPMIYIRKHWISSVLSVTQLRRLHFFFERLLPFEKVQVFYLSPNEVSILHFISKGTPRPSWKKPTYHTRIVPLSNINSKPMVILQRYLHRSVIRIINLPNQIPIMISFKRHHKLFLDLSGWTITKFPIYPQILLIIGFELLLSTTWLRILV